MRELHAWFGANSLKMNSGKTDFMIVGSKLNLTKTQNFRLTVENSSIQPSKEVKILGVTVDAVLSWEGHVMQVVRKCNTILFSLYRFRHYFTDDALKILVQAYVFPHILYCLCVWGGAAKGQMHKIQKIINFSARIVAGIKKNEHITPTLNSLGWPRIEALVARRDVTEVYKLLRTEGAPPNVRDLLVPRSAVSTRETRGSGGGDLHLRRCRLTSSQRAFSYRGAVAWNALSHSSGMLLRSELSKLQLAKTSSQTCSSFWYPILGFIIFMFLCVLRYLVLDYHVCFIMCTVHCFSF